MVGAGDLRQRVRFGARGVDANGDPGGGEFAPQFTVWAKVDYQRGSEVAVSNRLEGRQPAFIIIRDSSQARQITTGWRAVIDGGARDGEAFNITAVAPARERGFLSLMGASGVATG